MKHILKSASAACALLLLAALPAAQAQTSVVTKVNPSHGANKMTASSYWTPERFRAAKPMPLPQATPGKDGQSKQAPGAQPSGQPASGDGQAPSGQPASGDGRAPSGELIPAGRQLFVPGADTQNALRDEIIEPQATGTFGAHFSSSRVFPLFTNSAAQYSADRAYPYRTVGKLFFTDNGVGYVCSASVIQRRVVATAGHCVHDGTSRFYENFVFVPAFRDGTAPFNTWNWDFVATTTTWATGGGGVPNAADYAMLVFSDRALTPNGSTVPIGNVTGWLGWQTLSLIPNHTSKLGYPCNLDRCQKMQVVTSGSFQAGDNNTAEYGSDAQGGSSGGPWVQNFEQVPAGGSTGLNTGVNRVVGVTSYGYTNPAPKVQGASVFDNRWVAVLNAVCGAGAGNCN